MVVSRSRLSGRGRVDRCEVMVMSDEVRRRDRAHQILGLLDLTDLRPGVEADAIERLCARAVCVPGGVAAVCIAPAFVAQCARDLAGTGVKVATVVNFPAGSTDADAVAREVHGVIEHGADELDVVMPYGALLAGDIDGAARVLDTVAEIVQGRRIVKVILETGAFSERSAIVDAARFAVEHGADFLKTSTGTTAVSATPLAVGALLDVVRDTSRAVGIKPSGGISTLEAADGYLEQAEAVMGRAWIHPGTFRFGASGLFDTLCAVIEGHPCTRPSTR